MGGVNRRACGRLAGMTAAAGWMAGARPVWAGEQAGAGAGGKAAPLFGGRTLEGGMAVEKSAPPLSSGAVGDAGALAARLVSGTDHVSAMLRGKLEALVK